MDIELFDQNIAPNQPAPELKYSLWRFFDKDNKLLYISQKPNPAILMTKDWWFSTSHITVKHFSSMDDLIDAKAVAINNEDPSWNTIGRRVDG